MAIADWLQFFNQGKFVLPKPKPEFVSFGDEDLQDNDKEDYEADAGKYDSDGVFGSDNDADNYINEPIDEMDEGLDDPHEQNLHEQQELELYSFQYPDDFRPEEREELVEVQEIELPIADNYDEEAYQFESEPLEHSVDATENEENEYNSLDDANLEFFEEDEDIFNLDIPTDLPDAFTMLDDLSFGVTDEDVFDIDDDLEIGVDIDLTDDLEPEIMEFTDIWTAL